MPIKSSVLLRVLSDHAIGSIREQLAADVERLEAYHGKIDQYIADHNRDEPPKECERKPLRWKNGDAIYAVVRDSDNACLSAHNTADDARHHAETHTFPTSIVRVMEPVGNVCHTERIAPEGCEWGIMRAGNERVAWCARDNEFYATQRVLTESLRFPSKADASAYIATKGMTDCQPWPIPPKGGAE